MDIKIDEDAMLAAAEQWWKWSVGHDDNRAELVAFEQGAKWGFAHRCSQELAQNEEFQRFLKSQK